MFDRRHCTDKNRKKIVFVKSFWYLESDIHHSISQLSLLSKQFKDKNETIYFVYTCGYLFSHTHQSVHICIYPVGLLLDCFSVIFSPSTPGFQCFTPYFKKPRD